MSEDADLDGLLAQIAAKVHREDPDEHPAAEKLSAYQANELSPEEEDALQEHLATCGLCTERLLDLARFLRSEEAPAAGVADFQAAADWRQLRGRMEREGTNAVKVNPTWSPLRTAYAGLAALLVLSIGLSLYALSLRSSLRSPQPVASEKSLEPIGSLRGGSAQESEVEIPALIRLHTESEHSAYVVEIRTAAGRLANDFSVTVESGATEVAFLLPEGSLPPGKYEIRLLGNEGRRRPLIATYPPLIVVPDHSRRR